LQRIQNLQEEKTPEKETFLAALVFVPSVFEEKFLTAEF
jgi:hypothetical protein